MKFSGDKANFDFDGNTYFCLTDYTLPTSVQDASAQCSSSTGAQTFHAAGARDDSFTVNVLVDKGDTTTLNNLAAGNNGSFEFHPEGTATTGDIEFTATDALITQATLSGGTSTLNVLALTMMISGQVTVQSVP